MSPTLSMTFTEDRGIGEELRAARAMASNTGLVSVGELLMTFRISDVAVCCSSDSLVSLNSRTFSIAITAWSAKVLQQHNLLFGQGPGARRTTLITPMAASPRSIGMMMIAR